MVGSEGAEQLPFSTALRNVQAHCRSCSAKSPPWYFQDSQICCRRNVKKYKLWEVKNPGGSPCTKSVRKRDNCATVREIHCNVSDQQAFPETYMYTITNDIVRLGNGKCLEIGSWGMKIIRDSSHGTHFEHGLSPSWPSVVTCKLAFSF